jgi:hypothetical protein
MFELKIRALPRAKSIQSKDWEDLISDPRAYSTVGNKICYHDALGSFNVILKNHNSDTQYIEPVESLKTVKNKNSSKALKTLQNGFRH